MSHVLCECCEEVLVICDVLVLDDLVELVDETEVFDHLITDGRILHAARCSSLQRNSAV